MKLTPFISSKKTNYLSALPKKKILFFSLMIFFTIMIVSDGHVAGKTPDFKREAGKMIAVTGILDSDRNSIPLADFTNHPGFPINYDRWTDRASVTIADINNDGINELLLPTYDGYIYAWNPNGQLLSGFPISNVGWQISGRLTLGDLNHNGDLEIAAGLDSPSIGVGSKISIWRPNGQILPGWPKTTVCSRIDQYCNVSSIMMADLDKDSNLEIIASTTNRDLTSSDPSKVVPNLYVWKSNGELASGDWPSEDDHNVAIIGQMAVGDINGDTYPDIVVGRDYNRLFAFNRFGTNLNGWPHYVWYPYDLNNWNDDQIEFPRSSPALADLDLDGDLEYIIPGHRRDVNSTTYENTDLLVYNSNATRFSGWELPASGANLIGSNSTRMIEAPAIADLTGDNKPEIILAGQDGYIRVYTTAKQLLWSYDYAQGNDIHASETVIGDVDGDGWNDVVFGTFAVALGNIGPVGVYILNHNGVPLQGTPIWVPSPGISNSPALGDLDGDGLIEIAAATYNGWVYVWDTDGSSEPSNLPWPMPRHDLQRSGLYQDLLPDFSQSQKVGSIPNAMSGESVTFTLNLVNTGAPVDDLLHLTDQIPSGLTYVPGSLHATSGTIIDNQLPLIEWNGSMSNQNPIDIWYDVIVTRATPGTITNSAILTVESDGRYFLNYTLIVNGTNLYLPNIMR